MDVFDAIQAGVKQLVRRRRARRGRPLRPSWSEDYEAFAEMLRVYAHLAHRTPLALQRGLAERFLRDGEVAARTRREPVRARGVPGSWLVPSGVDAARAGVLLYLHGGGYAIGSAASHREPICRLCEAAGTAGLAIDYRLAPEHRFPAQLHDAVAAYRWLLDRGIAPSRIAIAGESAGGGLTLSTLLWLRDHDVPLPRAAVLISPWLDLEGGPSVAAHRRFDFILAETLAGYRGHFADPSDWRDPLAAPLYADPRGLPPLLVQVGGAEALLDDSLRFAAAVEEAGGSIDLRVAPDMIHAWHLFAARLPEGQRAIEEAGAFIAGALEPKDAAHGGRPARERVD
ncbi:MAG: alpha/beta hydrolase [Polyangiaceae bacterium]